MFDSIRQVEPAVAAIRSRWNTRPRAGLILGSGLARVVERIEVQARIAYASIPHFPPITAPGHGGELVCGNLEGVPLVALAGRSHLYEGRSAAEVAFAVRVLAALGTEMLVLSNACGGMNPRFRAGELMIVDDHVNLTFANPLVGLHDESSSVRYPDMSRPYDRRLVERAESLARRHDIVAHRGVYVGVLGPNYETRAEYRMLSRLGDAVGMSTVHEVIVAAQCKLRVLALSVVTNVCLPDRLSPTSAAAVLAVAAAAEPKLATIIAGVLSEEFRCDTHEA